MSNKTPYGEESANKYYIVYVECTGIRPLHIIIKNIKFYTDHVNVLAFDKGVLKYVEVWNKIEALFNKKINKLVCNNKYINTKINPYNENFHGFKKFI